MPVLSTHDGTQLAYRVLGEGTPVVCLAGGPMRDSVYLGELGGLPDRVQLIILDYRGTGRSRPPTDPATYRCDHLVADVETLREHLGLEEVNLLAHSAGADLAVLYAVRYPHRISRLVLITPSTQSVGIEVTSDMRREVVQARSDEPWFDAASAAFEAIQHGRATNDDFAAIAPLTYGRWDAAAQAHRAQADQQRNAEGAARFAADGAFDPPGTRTALGSFTAPTLLLSGDLDVSAPQRVVAEFAGLFPNATLVTQPGGGHYPWLDDPAWFTTTVATFLGR
ncbi:MAG TPA: alpha/beta hydrolase [Jiangellaceae bacterium]